MNPEISIIVPVYKTEQYLKHCLDSILVQTFKNFECILIDDGSPDICPAICDEYVRKDNRFKVIHQKNAGVSAARNAGLDIAQGKYIGFVDSDDWIDSDMYQTMYTNITDTKSDIFICGIYGKKTKRTKRKLTSDSALIELFAPDGFGGYSFNKLVKKEIIELYPKVRYNTSVSYHEDTLFLYILLQRSKLICWYSIPLYHYVNNPDSITSQYGLTKPAKNAIQLLDNLEMNEKRKKLKKMIKTGKQCFCVTILIQYLKRGEIHSQEFYDIYRKIDFRFLLFNKRISIKRKLYCVILLTPLKYIF
jgi:glycosyltransferase involved in cell wall biosynthesis